MPGKRSRGGTVRVMRSGDTPQTRVPRNRARPVPVVNLDGRRPSLLHRLVGGVEHQAARAVSWPVRAAMEMSGYGTTGGGAQQSSPLVGRQTRAVNMAVRSQLPPDPRSGLGAAALFGMYLLPGVGDTLGVEARTAGAARMAPRLTRAVRPVARTARQAFRSPPDALRGREMLFGRAPDPLLEQIRSVQRAQRGVRGRLLRDQTGTVRWVPDRQVWGKQIPSSYGTIRRTDARNLSDERMGFWGTEYTGFDPQGNPRLRASWDHAGPWTSSAGDQFHGYNNLDLITNAPGSRFEGGRFVADPSPGLFMDMVAPALRDYLKNKRQLATNPLNPMTAVPALMAHWRHPGFLTPTSVEDAVSTIQRYNGILQGHSPSQIARAIQEGDPEQILPGGWLQRSGEFTPQRVAKLRDQVAKIAARLAREQTGTLSVGQIMSRPWYRGDVTPWQHHEFDMGKADPSSLRGPGLYLTDNRQVAGGERGYVEKGMNDSTDLWSAIESTPGRLSLRVRSERAARAAKGEYPIGKPGYGSERFGPIGDPSRTAWSVQERYAKPGYGPRVQAWQVQPRPGVSPLRVLDTEHGQRIPQKLLDRLSRILEKNALWYHNGPGPAEPGNHLLGMSESEWRDYPNQLQEAASYVSDLAQREMRARQAGLRPTILSHSLWNNLNHDFLGPERTNAALKHAGVDALWYQGGVRVGDQQHNALNVINPAVASPAAGFQPRLTPRVMLARQAQQRLEEMTRGATKRAIGQAREAAGALTGAYSSQDLWDLAGYSARQLGYKPQTPPYNAFVETFFRKVSPRNRLHS